LTQYINAFFHLEFGIWNFLSVAVLLSQSESELRPNAAIDVRRLHLAEYLIRPQVPEAEAT